MGYRDELEAAHLRIAALEEHLRESSPPGAAEAEIARLRHELAQLRMVHQRREQEIAAAATAELIRLRARMSDSDVLIQKLRRDLEQAWRDSRDARSLRLSYDELAERASAQEERAERAEREMFRARMRLALERVRDVSRPDLSFSIAEGGAMLAERFGPAAWDPLDPAEVTQRLKELVVLAAHAVWTSKPGSTPDAEAVIAVLEAIGHDLPRIDAWSWGPRRADGQGLRVRIRSIELRAAIKRASGPLYIVSLEADRGLTETTR